MGCFSMMCGISGLSIGYGTPVYYMLLNGNPFRGISNACHSADIWAPRTFPLLGSYNHYGSVENVEDGPMRAVWLDGLNEDLVEKPVGENKYHDVPVSKNMSFDELLNAVSEGRLEYRYDSASGSVPPTHPIEHLMIRKDVWDGLCTITVEPEYRGQTVYTFDRMKTEIAKQWAEVLGRKALREEWKGIQETLKERGRDKLHRDVLDVLDDLPAGIFVMDGILMDRHGLDRHFKRAADRVDSFDGPTLELFLQRVTEMSYIQYVLMRTRFMWHPSYPIGPQEPIWSTEAAVMNVFAGIANAQHAAYLAKREE